MAKIESGTYRIVNIGRGAAITVPDGRDNTIVIKEICNQPSQQWLVQNSDEGYRIVDPVYGRYIAADVAASRVKAYLGCDPTLWEIVPGRGTTWNIKFMKSDFVLGAADSEDGNAVMLRHHNAEIIERCWRFERLGDLPDGEPRSTRSGTTEKDPIIGQMAENISQKDKQLAELVGQLANQTQRLADQNQLISDQNQRNADRNQRIADLTQKITDQQGEIFVLKRQIEEKDRELTQTNREVRHLLARVMQREEPLHQVRLAGTNNLGVMERVEGEVTLLRDEMERLKGLMNQLIDKDNKMPNNMC